MLNYIRESHKRTVDKMQNFYTASGISVYVRKQLTNDIDVEEVIAKVEERIPQALLSEVEMIMIGQFKEFQERNINAFYSDGSLFISNEQENAKDMIDDIVHEIAHSLESEYGYEIYGDENLKKEFLLKRKSLQEILWAHGFKAPESFFMNTEYDEEFDNFLLNKVGYDKLSLLMQGLFLSPYAAVSLKEYFATGFTEFFLESEHKFFKSVCPTLYKKVFLLQPKNNA